MNRRVDRYGGLILLLSLGLAVGGCARIPTGGPVVPGSTIAEKRPGLQVIVPGPRDGAGPVEIAEGFVQAGISAQDDYAAARSFLSTEAAAGWQPGRLTEVYSDELTFDGRAASTTARPTATKTDPGTDAAYRVVTVSFTGAETIDRFGRLRPVLDTAPRQVQLRLQRVDGQWRITSAPDLTLVAAEELRFAYSPYPIFFLDPTKSFLVPDPRWLPDVADAGTASRLTSLLLDGPPEWLAPAVTTAFGPGVVADGPEAVQVKSGVATVRLTAAAGRGSVQDQGLMRDQLLFTLKPVVGVDDVQLVAGGEELDATEVSVHATPPSVTEPVLVSGGKVTSLNRGRLTPLPGFPAVEGAIDELAVDNGAENVAVLRDDRTELQVLKTGRREPSTALTGARLIPPSYDWRGWLWSGESKTADNLVAISPEGKPVPVAAPALAGRTIDRVNVARDGTRVAIASRDATGVGRLELASIRRDRAGRPLELRLARPDAFGLGPVEVRDLTWYDSTHLIALAKQPDDKGPVLLRLEVGGPGYPDLPQWPDVKQVSAGGDLQSLRLLTGDRKVWTQAAGRWVEVPDTQGVRALAYPG